MNRIESRSSRVRMCKCPINHEAEIVTGMFHYSNENHVGYTACLVEHHGSRHVWFGFVTGAWEGVDAEDCCVLIHIYVVDQNIQMEIGLDELDPFYPDEIYESHILSREQVLAQPGAKEWIIFVYQELLKADRYIWNYLIGK